METERERGGGSNNIIKKTINSSCLFNFADTLFHKTLESESPKAD